MARAKQLIRALYPGLNGNLHPVITDFSRWYQDHPMNNFSIDFFDIEPKNNAGPVACWCSDPVLHVEFAFASRTENKELFIMGAVGPAAEGRRLKFAEEMNRHPKWSDAQVIAALNGAGARFGPDHKAEFLRALPLEELKPFVGALDVVSAEFYFWESDLEGKTSRANLTWIVQAKWHGSDGWEAGCTLAFEPFEGKLQSIRRDFSRRRTNGRLEIEGEEKVPPLSQPQRTPSK